MNGEWMEIAMEGPGELGMWLEKRDREKDRELEMLHRNAGWTKKSQQTHISFQKQQFVVQMKRIRYIMLISKL